MLQRLYLAGPGGLLRASCPSPLLHPSMGSALRASLRLFKFDPVELVGPHFVRSNSLQAHVDPYLRVLIFSTFIYKRAYTSTFMFGWAGRITPYIHVLRPSGQPSAVQICSRQICRTSYRFSFIRFLSINTHLHQCFFLAGPGGFEPPHTRIKTWCLTAWRRPNITKLAGALPPPLNMSRRPVLPSISSS